MSPLLKRTSLRPTFDELLPRVPADLLKACPHPELGFMLFLATVSEYYVMAFWPSLRRYLLAIECRLGLSGRSDSAYRPFSRLEVVLHRLTLRNSKYVLADPCSQFSSHAFTREFNSTSHSASQ